MASKQYAKGSDVKWKRGTGWGRGQVEEAFERRVQRTIKGQKIVRNGTPDEPAYLVKQEDGAQVLKLHSELTKQ